MSNPSNLKISSKLNVPDDAIVISADDAQVFINRLVRITLTMNFLYGECLNQKDRGNTDVGVIGGNIRFINWLYELEMYHIDGEHIGSFSWIHTDYQYFIGVAMELGDEYYEGKYIVDIQRPIAMYTDALKTQERYSLEELFVELIEFLEDYNMKAILR